MMKRAKSFMGIMVVIILIISTTWFHVGTGRSIRNDDETVRNDRNMVKATTTVTCEATYGFLPCSATLFGLLFMIIVYEVLLSFGEKYLSAGSDLFFETFGTGIIGSSVFHLLGTVPQVGLILVSGIAASSTGVAQQVEISMGLLVGKTAMSLTLIWGFIVAFGSHDISSSDSIQPPTKPFTFTGYGVTCDVKTSSTARIMLVSLIPYVILLFTKLTSSSSAFRVIVILALVVTLLLLIYFFINQSFQPWIQERRLEFVTLKYIRRNLLKSLLTADRKPNLAVIREIFSRIDQNGNSKISTAELKALVLGIQIEETGLHDHDLVSRAMEHFDSSGDAKINEEEFVEGLSTWLVTAQADESITTNKKSNLFRRKEKKASGTSEEHQSLIARTKATVKASNYEVWLDYAKAGLLIILGTAITTIVASPLGSTLSQFAAAANIPSFFIGYVFLPVALSARQAYRAVTNAKHKTERDISLTLSEMYNGVFMNNMVSMCIFLALVYARNLTPDVSAEILIVVILCLVMGLYGSFNTKFQFWTCIVSFLLYPVTLLIMYVLTTVLGRS